MAKTIADYKKDYAAAQARGDAAGMKAANDGANAIRAANGQKTFVASNAIAAAAAAQKNGGSSSQKSSTSGTAAGSGSVKQVTAYDDYQQQVKDQMAANSQAWHTATTQAEKDRLHEENVRLSQQLGGSVDYDASTGKWSGSASAPQLDRFLTEPETENYQPMNQSAYLESMADAYLRQQQAALKQAYESNTSDLKTEQDALGSLYDESRNASSRDDALTRRRFQETAAAYGLNSGTAGQADLSFANQRQQNLSALHAAEAAANQDIERQRANLAQEYRAAMVEAQAKNDYERFQQLYNEAVRVDEALQNQRQYNTKLALQKYQAALEQYNADQALQQKSQQQELENLLNSAKLQAQSGDYSQYGALYGWDTDTVQRMNAQWAAEQKRSTSSKGSSGGSSTTDQSGLLNTMLGLGSDAKAYEYLLGKDLSSAKTETLWKYYQQEKRAAEAQEEQGMNASRFRQMATALEAYLSQGKPSQKEIQERFGLDRYWGQLSQKQKEQIQTILGRHGLSMQA